MTLHIRQYVYFVVFSSVVPATEMATAVGLAPDEVTVRGIRRASEVPAPRSHRWKIVCDDRGMSVDEQLEKLIRRLRPHQPAIRALVERLHAREDDDGGARLQVVRYLDVDDGEAGDWQHRLLGWHLTGEVLRFALEVGAEIDVDEYGQDGD